MPLLLQVCNGSNKGFVVVNQKVSAGSVGVWV